MTASSDANQASGVAAIRSEAKMFRPQREQSLDRQPANVGHESDPQRAIPPRTSAFSKIRVPDKLRDIRRRWGGCRFRAETRPAPVRRSASSAMRSDITMASS